MGDIGILLPRTDYLPAQDDYDVLDSILFSAGFREEGFVTINEHVFRRYWISGAAFDAIPMPTASPSTDYLDSKLCMYMQEPILSEDSIKLSAYGIVYTSRMKKDDVDYYSYQIDRRHLPFLARMCQHGVRASRRIVEERSYYKFLERGANHGCDLTDWLTTEWEANERIQGLLDAMS